MKKIINNRVYDTTTAHNVAAWDNGNYGSFEYCAETLYRKKTGEYFLHGEGGARSRYAKSTGNGGWSGGEELIPLTYDAARAWAEEHLNGDEYEAIFGEVVEDDSRQIVTLSISTGAAEKLRRRAAETGVGLSAYVERLIDG